MGAKRERNIPRTYEHPRGVQPMHSRNPADAIPQKAADIICRNVKRTERICRHDTCVRKIASMYPDWQVVFAGNGEVEHGKALAASLGISSQTVFLGWVNGTDKDKAFKEASIFCLPSYAEGFPMAVLDAWAYGLPVITTPVGGLPDIAENGKNVLFFPPGDIDSLAKCLKKMINDEVFRTSISKESLKFSSDLFAVDVINNQIGEMYKDLCKNIKNNLLNRF